MLADTCNVYHHLGDNFVGENRLLMVQYTSPYALNFPLYTQNYAPWFLDLKNADEIEKLLFGKSYYMYKKYGTVPYLV